MSGFRHTLSAMRTFICTVCIVALCGCGGGNATESNTQAGMAAIQGAAVKGPLAHATIRVYRLDTSRPDFFDPKSPISTVTTTSNATFGGINVPSNQYYVLVVDGLQAIDLDTNQPPVITKMTTLVTPEDLIAQRHITATPLTTLAFEIGTQLAGLGSTSDLVVKAVNSAAELIRSTLIYGLASNVNLNQSPVLPTDATPSPQSINELVAHRAAIEYVSALLVKLSEDSKLTLAETISVLARDLAHDGIIDDYDGTDFLNVINLALFHESYENFVIPNTQFKIGEINKLLEAERTLLTPTLAKINYGGTVSGRPMQNSDADGDGIINVNDSSHYGDNPLSSLVPQAINSIGNIDITAFGPNADFHNHIHNFTVNDWDTSLSNYFLSAKHAAAMGYGYVSSRSQPTDRDLKYLRLIKNHNAYYSPIRFDFGTKQSWYFDWYDAGESNSPLRADRVINKWNTLDAGDFDILKTYGCQKASLVPALNQNSTLADLESAYYTAWKIDTQVNVIMNFMSKAVVDNLVENTLLGMKAGKYQVLFIDDLPREMTTCVNKEAGGRGSYSSWKDGQKDFMKRVVDGLRSTRHESGNPYRIFGNIWSPKLQMNKRTILPWYADGTLRLDHYYYESGAIKGETIEADGTDPVTGLPAYTSSDGYLPANLVSLREPHQWFQSLGTALTTAIYDANKQTFFQHALSASITAATQGSWLGWYGEYNVQDLAPNGSLMFTNDHQLLKVIPNWDNLAGVPLTQRSFDAATNVYHSPTSHAAADLIYSRRYDTGEVYAVYRELTAAITVPQDATIATAVFTDSIFAKTQQDAISCLRHEGTQLQLICSDKLGVGIRIRFIKK